MDSGVDISNGTKTEYEVTSNTIMTTTHPAKTFSFRPHTIRRQGRMTLEASEFCSFAMFRLWHPNNLQRRHTINNNERPKSIPALPPPYNSIISPSGAEEWYPSFVLQIHKLLSHCGLQTSFIFMALLYVARLRKNIPLGVASGSDYKLFLAALMLSQKQNSDHRYANRAWATMSGLALEDVNQLEKDFLVGIRWQLHIRDDQYTHWVTTMQALGKEHALVLRAAVLQGAEYEEMKNTLRKRPDLLEEVTAIRRTKTVF